MQTEKKSLISIISILLSSLIVGTLIHYFFEEIHLLRLTNSLVALTQFRRVTILQTQIFSSSESNFQSHI